MNSPFIIGITGGSASGKTFFLKSLTSRFQEHELCIISQDDYYHKKEKQPLDANGIENYDTPHSIDLESFVADLHTLCSGKEICKEEYTFNNPALKPKLLRFRPAPIVIVEGIYLFYHNETRQLLDLKIYLDANEEVKLKRRVYRDQAERGYTKEDVLYRYENHVSPNYEKYIKPFQEAADIIIPNNEGFDKALDLVATYIKHKLNP